METLATHGDVQADVYSNGAHHLYEVDAEGKKTHLGSDEYLRSMGYDPAQRNSNYEHQDFTPLENENTTTQIPVVEAVDPITEGAAAARAIGEDMNAQTDAAVDRLNEILPEPTLEQRFDQLSREMNERFESINRRMERMIAGEPDEQVTGVNPPARAGNAAPGELGANGNQQPDPVDRPGELGNRIGDPGQAEIRGQDQNGRPFIYRRNENGQWQVSRNGDLAVTWFDATPAEIARDLGLGDLVEQAQPAVAEEVAEPTPEEVAELTPEEQAAQEAAAAAEAEGAAAEGEEVPAEQEVVEEDNSFRGRARRAWNRMRTIANPNYAFARIVNRGASEELDNVPESERRRRSLGFVGAGVLLAAGGIITEVVEHYLEGKHGIPNAGIGQHIKGMGEGNGGGGGGAPAGSHVEFFNPSGHRLTGVELPKDLQLHGVPGSESIVDTHGNVVVPHVEWDSQGKLSRATMGILRAKGHSIGTVPLASRLMSDVR